jgi:kynureninase
MRFAFTHQFAREADARDPLRPFRNEYLFPQHEGREALYFTGNSLGLQPARTREYLDRELEAWSRLGVEAHFSSGHPWYSYHELLSAASARIVGALPEEVVVMNQLTVNLHLLLISFYAPARKTP